MAVKQDEARLRELSSEYIAVCALLVCASANWGRSLEAASDRMTPLARKRMSSGMSSVLEAVRIWRPSRAPRR